MALDWRDRLSKRSKSARSFWLALLDALVPGRCASCDVPLVGDPGSLPPFCRSCSASLPRWRRADGCPRCGSTLSPNDAGVACPGCLSRGSALHRCHALLRYEGAIRRLAPAFKNPRGSFGPPAIVARAIDALAGEFGERGRPELTGRLDLIASIPLHPRRQRRRGFNHVDPIAWRIAGSMALPWQPGLLARVRETAPQASLEGISRAENLRGAFRVARPFERDLRIGLVDDVLTTGSTLEAAADVLLEAGAFEVRGLTLAATLPHSESRRRSRAGPRGGAYAPAAPAGRPGPASTSDPIREHR